MRGIITSSTTRSKVCSEKRVERLAAVGCLHDVVAVPLQRERQQRLDRLLVVDEQDARGSVGHDLWKPRIVGETSRYRKCGARRTRLPGRLPARADRRVRRGVLAHGPAGADDDGIERRRVRLRRRRSATARARSATRSTSSRARSPTAPPAPTATRGSPTAWRPRSGVRERSSRRPAFEVTRSTTEWDGEDLETVVGVRPGPSSRRIVVLASRDARGPPGPRRAVLDGGAARARPHLPPRELRKTLVLVSTSGATTGFAGARAWAREAADDQGASPVDAVIVLGDMAGKRIRKPWVVPWTTDGDAPPLALQRTVESALRAEVSPEPRRRARLGPVDPPRAAADAVRPRASWPTRACRPCCWARTGRARGARRRGGHARAARLVRARAAAHGHRDRRGRAARPGARGARARSFSRGPDGIVTMRNVLPDWAVRLLVGTLLLPALLAALDGWFRARRRHLPVGRWAGWIAAAAVAPLLAWLWLRLLGLTARSPCRPRRWSPTSTRSRRPGSSRSPRRRSSPRSGGSACGR